MGSFSVATGPAPQQSTAPASAPTTPPANRPAPPVGPTPSQSPPRPGDLNRDRMAEENRTDHASPRRQAGNPMMAALQKGPPGINARGTNRPTQGGHKAGHGGGGGHKKTADDQNDDLQRLAQLANNQRITTNTTV